VAGYCGHGDEPSGSITCLEFTAENLLTSEEDVCSLELST